MIDAPDLLNPFARRRPTPANDPFTDEAPPPFDDREAIARAVHEGAFWGAGDAWAALEAMRFCAAEQAAWPGGLGEMWSCFVSRRAHAVEAIARRGLRLGAFRHRKHAVNALNKLRREADAGRDFIDAWQAEVERRIETSQMAEAS